MSTAAVPFLATAPKNADLQQAADLNNLRRAWLQIRRRLREDSFRDSGIHDPLEWVDFELFLDANLRRIREAILRHRYDPGTPVFIQKARGKGLSRPISVISIDDAVAFQAAVILIAPLTISNRWQGAFDMVPR